MKKLISLALAMVLCLSLCTIAFAEADTETVLWSETEAALVEAGIEGDYLALEDVGLQVWVPAAMYALELSDEMIENGYIAYCAIEDGSFAMGVQLVNNGCTREEYLAYIQEKIDETAEIVPINGAEFIIYSWTTDEGVACNVATLVNDEGYVLEFAFTAGDENLEALSVMMIYTIHPIEE